MDASQKAASPVVYPELTPEFKQRRTLNWLAVGLLYAFFYTTRYNWTVVSPKIANVLGWQNTQLGVFETMMPIVYAFSVILNGPIADRIGGKKAFLFGAVGVVISLGLLLAFQGVPLILLGLPWQYAFWIPGACVAIFFLINMAYVNDSPAQAGLGEFETGDASDDGAGPASLKFVVSKIFAS